MLTLDTIKLYLRIQSQDEDEILTMLYESVVQYVKMITSLERPDENSEIKISILDHIAYLYENRGTDSSIIPERITKVYQKYKNIRI